MVDCTPAGLVMAVYNMSDTVEPQYLAEKLLSCKFRGGLIVPATRLLLAKDSFCFRGGDCWLSLPEAIRNIRKVGEFKKYPKTFTMTNITRFLDPTN